MVDVRLLASANREQLQAPGNSVNLVRIDEFDPRNNPDPTLRIAPSVLIALLAATVSASAEPAMTFALGRLSGSKACGPPCAEFMVAKGEIGFTSVLEYVGARQRAGDRNLPIILESPGGIIGGAKLIARLWRDAGLTVIVAGTRATCGPDTASCAEADAGDGVRTYEITRSGYCASACLIMLAGGVRRLTAPAAQIGVHRPHIEKDSWIDRTTKSLGAKEGETEQRSVDGYSEALIQYGIDPAVGHRASRTASTDIDWFGRDEARKYRLVNAAAVDLTDLPALATALQRLEAGHPTKPPAR